MHLISDNSIDQTSWDSPLLQMPNASFLQSWAWGEFQKSLGNSIWRIQVVDQNEVIGQLLIIRLSLGLGKSILYGPRAQLFNTASPLPTQIEASKLLLQKVRELALQNHCIFVRIDPPVLDNDQASIKFYDALGFIHNQTKSIQPQYNQIISLGEDLRSVLAKAKSKTRYNIGLAQKYLSLQELRLTDAITPDIINNFISLTTKTASRHNFSSHSRSYYEKQISILAQYQMVDLLTAFAPIDMDHPKENDTCLGSILVVYFGDTATYIHGASSDAHRYLMAPYLLHYEGIRHAQARGMASYDLGGVHPNPKHKWFGITRFKQGFGGETIKYIGTLELPIDQLAYRLYRIISFLK